MQADACTLQLQSLGSIKSPWRQARQQTCRPLLAGAYCQYPHRRLLLRPQSRVSPAKRLRAADVLAAGVLGSQQAVEARTDSKTAGSPATLQRVLEESQQLLEWPQLCRQVAAFAATSLAARRILDDGLPEGRSQGESELLLQETAEAQQADLHFEGTFDLHPVVEAAANGHLLNAWHLNAVASTLSAAQRLGTQVGIIAEPQDSSGASGSTQSAPRKGINCPDVRAGEDATPSDSPGASGNSQSGPHKGTNRPDFRADEAEVRSQGEPSTSGRDSARSSFPSLARIMQGSAGGLPRLSEAIGECIGEQDGRVLDRASPSLASIRSERRENLATLRKSSVEWARQLHSQGVSETAQISTQRGRLCVAVRAGRQGELPKGSVKLAASRTGATVYMEPAPMVTMNNQEAQLSGQEREEEVAILMKLTQLVVEHGRQLIQVVEAVTALDTVSARAGHATWLSGVRPSFHAPAADLPSVNLPRARHPLLLERSLPALPAVPEYDDSEFDNSYLGRMKTVEDYDESTSAGRSAAMEFEGAPRGNPPRSVDLTVPAGKTGVVLTGPNTGGKTASLKTLGLLVLMSKAGLFLPLEGSYEEGSYDAPATLQWFDKVLADVGDSQDLTQSLSTFSGHVQRLRRILTATGSSSLVLLDELGSGTDPVEGGALAAVLLESLLDRAGLIFATSHHAELKDLPVKDSRFVNACVEFDNASLMPTYRLLWGMPGDSQALAVAHGLGFDRDIVAAARQIAADPHFMATPGNRAGQLKESMAEQVAEARQLCQAAAEQRAAAEKLHGGLQSEWEAVEKLRQQLKEPTEDLVAAAKDDASTVLKDFISDSITAEQAQERLQEIRARAPDTRKATATLIGLRTGTDGDLVSQTAPADYSPQPGEMVSLLNMGGAVAQVIQGAGRSGGKLTVRLNNMTVEVRTSEVTPASSNSGQGPKKGDKRGRAAWHKKAVSEGKPGQQKEGSRQGKRALRVQTEDNTADLRGMRRDEALAALENALQDNPQDTALYVVHGHGTGQIKAAVREYLKSHALVQKFEDESSSAGGCTLVELKQ